MECVTSVWFIISTSIYNLRRSYSNSSKVTSQFRSTEWPPPIFICVFTNSYKFKWLLSVNIRWVISSVIIYITNPIRYLIRFTQCINLILRSRNKVRRVRLQISCWIQTKLTRTFICDYEIFCSNKENVFNTITIDSIFTSHGPNKWCTIRTSGFI